MRKKGIILLLALSCVLPRTVCAAETEEIKQEGVYEAVEPKIYPRPEDAYVGDVMPVTTEDGVELYYLYDTDHNTQYYHPIHKYVTKNFYEYEDMGEMVPCGVQGDTDPAIGTGSVVKGRDGLYHCFYTGHDDNAYLQQRDKECVMHAVSEDRMNWTKIPEDTFFAEENYSGEDFRDPFVFWNEEEQCYWLLIAARENALGGVVAKYTSTDLSKWTICDPIYAPQSQYMLECPDLFKMGDYYYLFYSWDCVTYYAMSDSINGPFKAPEDNVLDGTGFVYYAAKTTEFEGKRYLCAWIGRNGSKKDTGMYDWAGNLMIHELVQKEDGRLGVREPESLSEYFTKELQVEAVKMEGDAETLDNGGFKLSSDKETFVAVDLGMRQPVMLLECDVTAAEDGCAGFAFGGADEAYEDYAGLTLNFEQNKIHYEGAKLKNIGKWDPFTWTSFNFVPGQTYHVKLVAENEIVVLYIDDVKALSSRIYRSIDGNHIGLFAKGTDTEFRNLTLRIPE